jgi:cobalt-zinc-cadmium efflux system membrane fusion protein
MDLPPMPQRIRNKLMNKSLKKAINKRVGKLSVLLLCSLFFVNLLVAQVVAQETVKNDGHSHQPSAAEVHEHESEKHSGQLEQKDDHDHQEGHEEESQGVALSDKQMALADIKVTTVTAKAMDYQVYAPGEVKANGYTTYHVSPRVDSVVLRRHVVLGEHVTKGQALVTMFSESMVDAQAAYSIASSEWLRVKKLGKKAVGGKRYVTAQTEFKAAKGRLVAYGLVEHAIERLLKGDDPLGEYILYAPIDGAVLTDDFHQGQRVSAGDGLIELADESQLWVDASFPANMHLAVKAGTKAQVQIGHDSVAAIVIQEAHIIDRQTRTRVVRLLIDNIDDHLHSGMFADVFFSFKTNKPVLAVPENALMRSSDGNWTIFVEFEPGRFKAQEVTLGQSLGPWREIIGVKPGIKVVTQGAFFVASQIAKGGFDPHNH